MGVRPTRVTYVENDPALRGIMSILMGKQPQIDLILSTGSAQEALQHPQVAVCDAALLDLALGTEQMTGWSAAYVEIHRPSSSITSDYSS